MSWMPQELILYFGDDTLYVLVLSVVRMLIGLVYWLMAFKLRQLVITPTVYLFVFRVFLSSAGLIWFIRGWLPWLVATYPPLMYTMLIMLDTLAFSVALATAYFMFPSVYVKYLLKVDTVKREVGQSEAAKVGGE